MRAIIYLGCALGIAHATQICSQETARQIGNAILSCCRVAGLGTVEFLPLVLVSQLRNPASFLRGEYCAGVFGSGCAAMTNLSHDDAFDCDFNIYQGSYFNLFKEAPTFCKEDAHHAVRLYTQLGKVLAVDAKTSIVVAKPPDPKPTSDPSFVYYFGHHMFQSAQNDECLVATDTQVHTAHCDVEKPDQKWAVDQFNSVIRHISSDLCLTVDPLDGTHQVRLAPCKSSRNQLISTSPPPSSPFGQFQYDVVYEGEELIHFTSENPTACSWRCQIVDKCQAFTWLDGVCSLKKYASRQVPSLGGVSSQSTINSSYSFEL